MKKQSLQFAPESARPLTPRAIAASVRRGRQLLAQIEHYADPQDVREKQRLTRAIHGLAMWSRSLSARHRNDRIGVSGATEN